MVITSWILSQSTPAVEVPWAVFVNYGVLGLMVGLMLFGYLYPKPMVDQLREQIDRLGGDNEKLRDENRELRTRTEDRVIPALIRNADVLDKLASRGGARVDP